jgi:predicted RNA-binding Zn-ribbon protein involved in translation (DUF1610 family)
MPLRKSRLGHPKCPKCQMGMIVESGYGADPARKTYECLQCGFVGKPAKVTLADVEG